MKKIFFISLVLMACFLAIPLDVLAENKVIKEVAPASLEALIQTVSSYLLTFTISLAVLFVLIGGIMYLTSGGNEEKVGVARKTLTYAIIGLVVSILALVIVNFVTNTIANEIVK